MQTILELYTANRLDEALARVAELPENDDTLYMKGKILWKLGRRTEAITAYNEALALNPDSSAAIALAQARQIMDFYNKDLYNP